MEGVEGREAGEEEEGEGKEGVLSKQDERHADAGGHLRHHPPLQPRGWNTVSTYQRAPNWAVQ